MNFTDLYKKIRSIDESLAPPSGPEFPSDGELSLGECGDDMPEQEQPESTVEMEVSMRGVGADGIRDLMDVLKNIESGNTDTEEFIFAEPETDEENEMGEEFLNKPNSVTLDIDSITPTGDDMHSKGMERPKMNGGGNPMAVSEALRTSLYDLYNEIIEGTVTKTPTGLIHKGTYGTSVKNGKADKVKSPHAIDFYDQRKVSDGRTHSVSTPERTKRHPSDQESDD